MSTTESRTADPRESKLGNLTRGQMLLWTGQQLRPDAPLYNMAAAWTIEGRIDESLFTQSFHGLVEVCDALRTTVASRVGVPEQTVREDVAFDLPVIDFSGEPDPTAAAADWTRDCARQRLDIETRSFDSALLKLSDARYQWFFTQHHVLTDAWSFAVLFDAMSDIYGALLAGAPPAPDVSPFTDYVAHEAAVRPSATGLRLEPTVRPVLYGRKLSVPTTLSTRVTIDLGAERSQRVRELAQRPGVQALTLDSSVFRVFAAAMFAYLHRVSGDQDLTIGAPVHNRTKLPFTRTAGLFTELFPASVDVDASETFRSLLEKVQLAADSLLRSAGPGRSGPDRNRPFSCVLNLLRASFGDFAGIPTTTEWIHPGHADPEHQLRVHVHDFGLDGRYQVDFDCNAAVFDNETQRAAPQHFLRLLDAMLDDWDLPITEVDLLSPAQRRELTALTSGEEVLPADPTVLGMFDSSAAATPDAIALSDGDLALSYRDLLRATNHLADELHQRGIGPGSIVGICITRSAEAVVAMLAVLRSGAAYAPLDPSWPAACLAWVVEDLGAPAVIGGPVAVPGLPRWVDWMTADLTARSDRVPTRRPHPDSTAYVMYTSGSTGRPKGVVVSHRALGNYVSWARRFYGHGLTFPLFTPLTFDLTVTSIYVPMCSGGAIAVYRPTGDRADSSVLQVFDDDAVDIVKLTPSHLALVADQPRATTRISQLIVGGEDLQVSLARRSWQALDSAPAIHNEYGPTEATVGCIVHTLDPSHDLGGSVPIGRPIQNMRADVVDSHGRPVPPGVVGELSVAGLGLAERYHNRPELTAERFVADETGTLAYRTGDRARVRNDGVFEYLGRSDDQVKVRGARVELGEVEWALAQHPSVTAAVAGVTSAVAASAAAEVIHCSRCGLASSYPGTSFDDHRVCNLCRSFDTYREKASAYFTSMDELRSIFDEHSSANADHDCIALLSGGKDSTYMLCQLVDMGLDVLAFTLDNGFISEEAKSNITRVVNELEVDHVFGATPHMNEIFVDSLNRHCNVCHGCFKTIYTLSTQLAVERDIPFIVTGLSRGQFFETRLTEELFVDLDVDVDEIDRTVLEARKAYHRVDDAPRRVLDVSVFDDDDVFEKVRFVDFYRYCPVELDDLLLYLDERVPWIRPTDTGRSTNCLINDVGIYIHTRERGYHNYALPYSWDVRLGHKTRDAAVAELNDSIDPERVESILDEIGYKSPDAPSHSMARLVGYYAAPAEIPANDLRAHVERLVPAASVPSQFVRLDALPLTSHGKVDRAALPDPAGTRPDLATAYVAPSTDAERTLSRIWADVLGVERVGARDDFFQLGGDSIVAIQIVARAQRAGLELTPAQLFDAPSVAELARLAARPGPSRDHEPVGGDVGFTPAQLWLLEQGQPTAAAWNQVVHAALPERIESEAVERGLAACVESHGALRQSFVRDATGHWTTEILDTAPTPPIRTIDVTGLGAGLRTQAVARLESTLHDAIDPARPPLLACGLAVDRNGEDLLVLVGHHLVVDAVSWSVLLDDLVAGVPNPTTTPLTTWTAALRERAVGELTSERDHWLDVTNRAVPTVPRDIDGPGAGTVASEGTIVARLGSGPSNDLVRATPKARVTVHELLVAGLVCTLADWSGSDPVRLVVEGHGRDAVPALNVTRTVGWFTSLYPVTIDVGPGREPIATLRRVKDQLRAVPGSGNGYGPLCFLDPDPERRAELALATEEHVLFNYMGRGNALGGSESGFREARPLALHRGPQVRRPFLVEVNTRFVAGELHIEWSYSAACHREDTIRHHADRMVEHVEALLDGCLAAGDDAVSTSDFPLAGLDDRRLSQLAAALGEADPEPS